MSSPQFILQALFFVVNSFALFFIVLFVCRMYTRMNNKLEEYLDMVRHISIRNDIIYLNQLETMKVQLLKSERYEEAQEIDNIIKNEMKNLNKNKRAKI